MTEAVHTEEAVHQVSEAAHHQEATEAARLLPEDTAEAAHHQEVTEDNHQTQSIK